MGRWIAEEEAALTELRQKLKVELANASQFPGEIECFLWLTERSSSRAPTVLGRSCSPSQWIIFSLNIISVFEASIWQLFWTSFFYIELVGDRRLIRFLRGRQNNVDLAAAMFKEHLKWRKVNKTDEIRNRIAFGGLNHPHMFPCGKRNWLNSLYVIIGHQS